MIRRHLLQKIFFILLGTFDILFFLAIRPTFAQGVATINLSPNSGSFNKQFNANVVVDGGGQVFNAAQATVNVPASLSITNLTLGDCHFSFLSTPSIINPSFAGVILGGSSKNCTVYTLTLAPVQKGNASVILSKGSVRRYGDAVNILSSMQNGTYVLTGVVKVTPQPTIVAPTGNLYTLVLTVTDVHGTSVKNTQVDIRSVASKVPLQGKTDATGKVLFQNIQQGIYDATVQGYAGETILNVTGRNHILMLGVRVQNQQYNIFTNPLILGGLVIISIFIGGLLVWLFLRRH